MRVVTTIREVREACLALRGRDVSSPLRRLGLVPTMGALHTGHLSLVCACRQECDIKAVSIFVNPTQFGPAEDLALYPRTFEEDCRMLEAEGVDLLFAPEVPEIYPGGQLRSFVDVGEIGERLDGRSRPGHFRGVATVVLKLFGIVTPDVAYFGQKDAAQVAVIRVMVEDLNLPVRVVVCPIVRESDGVALSSRNRYLSASERVEARALSAALRHVEAMAGAGATEAWRLRDTLHEDLGASPGLRIDYAEVVDPETLLPLASTVRGALVAVAAWIGSTRLIDNILLTPAGERASR